MIETVQPLVGMLTLAGYFEYSVMVSWMHNTAIGITDIGGEYNHREHRGAQRGTEDRFKNSVLSVSSVVKSGGFYRLCWIDSTTTVFRI